MILEISEALKLLNANGIAVKGLSLDANGNLDLAPADTNFNKIRIGVDPSTGNGGIQINPSTGRIDLYGSVYVNGSVVATV